MLPAYAGMIRSAWRAPAGWVRAPRVCGDDPSMAMDLLSGEPVLPAYAGMILPRHLHPRRMAGAPRVCGDDPSLSERLIKAEMCSPRMRG